MNVATHNVMDKSHRHYIEQRKPETKVLLYESNLYEVQG